MSLQSHLSELERRREALKKEIEAQLLQPSGDDLHIAELKRKKLAIKDEIERLRHETENATAH